MRTPPNARQQAIDSKGLGLLSIPFRVLPHVLPWRAAPVEGLARLRVEKAGHHSRGDGLAYTSFSPRGLCSIAPEHVVVTSSEAATCTREAT